MKVKEILKFIENKEKELSTYKETDKEIARNLCSDKNKKIIEFNEIYAIENVLNRLEQLEKENKEIKNNLKLTLKSLELIQENSIPKSVIKDKIEELEDKLKDVSKRREKAKAKEEENILWCLQIRLDEKIKTLKEILGGIENE